jgi:hypothetical protein
MTYTPMTDLSTGSLVTETIWDNQIQGNIEHLLSRVEPTLTNKSGSSQSAGAVVVVDASNDSAFTTTTTQDDEDILGVVQETIANDATGRVLTNGAATVNVQGNVTRGDFLRTSATAGRAETAGTSRSAGTFAQAMTTYSGGGAGTVTAMVLTSSSSSSSGVGSATWAPNLIKNFPSLEAADGAQPEWWEEATGNITITEEDAGGETIEEKYERVLKIVTTAGGSANYGYQTLTYADEWALDISTTNVSAGVWIYNTTTGTVTLELTDAGSGSLGTDTTTAENAWTFLSIRNVTLGSGASLEWKIYHSAAATLYATLPTLHPGATPRPWEPRRLRYVQTYNDNILTENPGADSWADLDFTASTTANTAALDLGFFMANSGSGTYAGYVRPNGSALAQDNATMAIGAGANAMRNGSNRAFVLCDDGQVIEESVVGNAGITAWAISLQGYWEWE